METTFTALHFKNGKLFDLSNTQYPSKVYAFDGMDAIYYHQDCSYYGYVFEGHITIRYKEENFTIKKGMYFSVPKELNIQGTGKAFIIEHYNHTCFFQLGGPVEEKGRIESEYNRSNSLLIAPTELYQPSLNLLQIHKNQEQLPLHIHNEYRIGMVIEGSGYFVTDDEQIPLEKGEIFILPANLYHRLEAIQDNENLLIISYHPKSQVNPIYTNEQ